MEKGGGGHPGPVQPPPSATIAESLGGVPPLVLTPLLLWGSGPLCSRSLSMPFIAAQPLPRGRARSISWAALQQRESCVPAQMATRTIAQKQPHRSVPSSLGMSRLLCYSHAGQSVISAAHSSREISTASTVGLLFRHLKTTHACQFWRFCVPLNAGNYGGWMEEQRPRPTTPPSWPRLLGYF